MNPIKHLSTSFLLLFISLQVKAQCSPALPHDSLKLVTNEAVTATAQQGNILYLGGDFTVTGTYTGSCIGVDINTSKPVYNSWPLVRGHVYKMLPDGNGGWYLGGAFVKVGDSLRNGIAHINSGGAVSAWNPDLVSNGTVSDMFIKDSILYVAGRFHYFLGDTVYNLVAVNMTTGLLTNWRPKVNESVLSMQLIGNTLYIGGTFLLVNDSSRTRLAAVDINTGQLEPWAPDIPGSYVGITRMLQLNGRLFITGGFTSISGINRKGFAEMDLNTDAPAQWNPPVSGSFNDLAEHNGDLYLTGWIDSIPGYPKSTMLKVDTSQAAIVDTLNLKYPYGVINKMCFRGDTCFLGGDFQQLNGVSRYNIAAFNVANNSLTSWTCHSGKKVEELFLQGNILYLGGQFTNIGKATMHLAAVDMNADTLLNWFPSVNSRSYLDIDQLLLDGDKLYLAGRYDSVNGQARRSLAAINRHNGTLLPWAPQLGGINYGVDSSVYCIALSGDKIYMGGNFNKVNGVIRQGLASVDTVTGLFTTSWNPHTYSNASMVQFKAMLAHDTSIYIGGSFYDLANTQRSNIAKLGRVSGAADAAWHPSVLGYQMGNWAKVNSMAVYGGDLYFTGAFYLVDSQQRNGLAKVSLLDGALSGWPSFSNNQYYAAYTRAQLNFIGNSMYVARDSFVVYDVEDGNTQNIFSFGSNSQREFMKVNRYNNKMYISGYFTNAAYPLTGANLAAPVVHNLMHFTVPDAPAVNIYGTNPVCENTPVTYAAISPVQNATYQWQVNDVNVNATSTLYTYTPQNGDVVRCVITDPATPCFSAPIASDEKEMNVIPANTIPIASLSGEDTLCSGEFVSYEVSTNVYGASYQWQVNGINPGNNSATYTYFPADGDSIKCTVFTPPLNCYSSTSATTNTISIDVEPVIIPSISIAAGNFSVPGTLVWVHANVSNVPNGYTILWLINGLGYTTTDNVSYTAYTKGSGADTITAIVFPHDPCFETDTSNVFINYSTSVEEVTLANNISAYPNPFRNEINMTGLGRNDKVEMYNVVGEKKQEWITNVDQSELRLSIKDLPAGVYMLRITRVNGDVRKTIPLQKW